MNAATTGNETSRSSANQAIHSNMHHNDESESLLQIQQQQERQVYDSSTMIARLDGNSYDRNMNSAAATGSATSGTRTGSSTKGDIGTSSGSISGITSSRRGNTIILLLLFSAICYGTFYCGWYIPRYYMDVYIDDIINKNPPPYQVIMQQQQHQYVILDPTYNHPVIDPPKITSSFLIATAVYLPLTGLCLWPFVYILTICACSYCYCNNNMPLNCCRRIFCSSSSVGFFRNRKTGSTMSTLLQQKQLFTSTTTNRCRSLIQNYPLLLFQCAASECIIMVSGLLLSIGLCEGITQCMKMYVGRLRPNMYELCQFLNTTLDYSTTVSKEQIREGHLSFPSGHSSLASVSMIYCTWYIYCNYCSCYLYDQNSKPSSSPTTTAVVAISLMDRPINTNTHSQQQQQENPFLLILALISRIGIIITLPGYAIYVGCTRIVDHWHHVSDVVTGLLLGSIIGTVIYHTTIQPLLQYITTILVHNDINSNNHYAMNKIKMNESYV